jgi:protein-S-isoprenylcysteine O-methyltransferase Ste14
VVLIPDFGFGILNGWLAFAAYLLVFAVTLFSFPGTVRSRLYDRSRWNRQQRILTAVGKVATLANLVLFVLSPLRSGFPIFYVGVGLWCLGLAGLTTARLNYGNTPLNTPVTRGVYRISRNPQVFSIWIIFLGICFMIGSGLSLIIMGFSLVFLHRSVLAEERACLEQYGDAYREYIKRVPRYAMFS